ncbi:MAG: hypothetical protein WCJ72_19555, partial [Chryseobacterium sp.]
SVVFPFSFTVDLTASLEILKKMQAQTMLIVNKIGVDETEKYYQSIKAEAYAQVTPNSEYILNKLIAKRLELEQ